MSVSDNLKALRSDIPEGVRLVAVSKFHPVEALMQAYAEGQRLFGESRAAELCDKAAVMPSDVEWHFIGHLQTNKVRQIIPHVAMIHSVDSVRLLQLIDSEARRAGRVVPVLIQLHVALEETKFGFTPGEALSAITPALAGSLPNVRVAGVMGMASNVDDTARIQADFRLIHDTWARLRESLGNPDGFDTVSMGMSHDWPLAVSEGANMIRVGTTIFGEREY
ncbi:MAG: YggS family pyridoxal phosphate-dependent enzyme [Duncaniella sp.]|nr:YggS family pyridoxal phosphate-dependent enzyme [Duncaniella sp.]